jgi:osmoprotectant transport system permease protein
VSAAGAWVAFLVERRAEFADLLAQHLVLVLLATAIAAGVGLPAGIALARAPRLARAVLGLAGVVQTIPSLALFGLLLPLPLLGGIGAKSAVLALVLYALLPILRNTVTGLAQLDPTLLDAATAMGMTPGQRLRLVELPLALPVVLAGVRLAAVVTVGTATIAAAIGAGGLGTYVFRGLATLDLRLVLLGAVPSALLALAVDALLARVEHARRPGRAALLLLVLSLVTLAVAASSAWRGSRATVVVGSKNFTEQLVLGEIVAQQLEARGFAVRRRLNLGGTALCHAALLRGDLDVYVEYTGTAWTDVLRGAPSSDPRAVLDGVRAGYAPLGLTVGRPLGFDNTFALVMRRDVAERWGVARLSDLAPHAARLRVGLFGEFLERADGLPGLLRTYGFALGVKPREMDLGLLYPALQQDRIDLAVGSATDGLIAALDLVVLEDDRRYFPPYDAVPVARTAALDAHPGLRAALDGLGGRLDAASMRRLNDAVDREHRAPADVARDWLRARRP